MGKPEKQSSGGGGKKRKQSGEEEPTQRAEVRPHLNDDNVQNHDHETDLSNVRPGHRSAMNHIGERLASMIGLRVDAATKSLHLGVQDGGGPASPLLTFAIGVGGSAWLGSASMDMAAAAQDTVTKSIAVGGMSLSAAALAAGSGLTYAIIRRIGGKRNK